jgi:hypothetical protein
MNAMQESTQRSAISVPDSGAVRLRPVRTLVSHEYLHTPGRDQAVYYPQGGSQKEYAISYSLIG